MRDRAVIVAHQTVGPSELAGSWTFEPVLLATLAVTAFVYGRGRARLGRRVARPDGRRRAIAFYNGLAVLAAALLSPLDPLASTLFSAHMVQHLLLMLVAAPLLVHARPTAALVAGLPAGWRQAAHGIRSDPWRAAARTALNPLVVWAAGALALWAWHVPPLYEAALAHDAVHVLEHTSFLGAAVLFWAVVLASGTRSAHGRRGVSRPVAMLLVFASSVQSSALGLLLLLAPNALYPVHAPGARAWEVSLLGDQHVAGGLMWGPPTFLYVVVIGWLVVRWFAEMEATAPGPRLARVGEAA
ncbi:MAG TPA: cytochrome c oxidase assembly protein [Acidimicrobiales bacterium]|nr:cytochrome c oxidase assembly protein [Acidimicrobiales bacterium]